MTGTGRTFITGHNGLVGRALVRAFANAGMPEPLVVTRDELDLTSQVDVLDFFEATKPTRLINAAALVGGIKANASKPGDFIGINLMIVTNLLEAARRHGTSKVVTVESGCCYPREAPLPTKETDLLAGPLERTNIWYATAKIASIMLGDGYSRQYGMNVCSLLPCSLYGPHDNFHLESSHVIPGMLRKFHSSSQANQADVELWGTGKPTREFMHVDDMANACLMLLEGEHDPGMYNVGTGVETSMLELASMVGRVVGNAGKPNWSGTLDGTPRKLLDSSKIRALGWSPKIALEEGLAQTYAWMCDNMGNLRMADYNRAGKTEKGVT